MDDSVNGESLILEEEIDPNYVPDESEVVEYAKWLGMDLDADKDLFWIAREGLMAPLPKDWKPCKTKDTDDIYYFNFMTGESTWDHPCDGFYKQKYEEEKKKKEISKKEKNDQRKLKAKQDVSQMIGKTEKKKLKSSSSLDLTQAKGVEEKMTKLSAIVDKKPLPNISKIPSFGEKISSFEDNPLNKKPLPSARSFDMTPTDNLAGAKLSSQRDNTEKIATPADDSKNDSDSDNSNDRNVSKFKQRFGDSVQSNLSVSLNNSPSDSAEVHINNSKHPKSTVINVPENVAIFSTPTRDRKQDVTGNTYRQLQDEIENLKLLHNQKIDELHRSHKSEIELLQSNHKLEVANLEDKKLFAEGMLKKLRDDLDSQRRAVSNLREDMQKSHNILENEKSLRNAQRKEADEQIRVLKNQYDELRSLHEDANKNLINVTMERDKWYYKSLELETQWEELNSRNQDGRSIESMIKRNDELELQLKQREESSLREMDVNNQHIILRNHITELEEQLNLKVIECAKLQDNAFTVKQLTQRIEELEFIVNTERQSHLRTKAEYDKLKGEYDTFRNNLSSTAGDNASHYISVIKDLERRLEEMSLSKDNLILEWKSKHQNLSVTSSNSLEEYQKGIEESRFKLSRVEQQLKERVQEYSDLDLKNNQLQEKFSISQYTISKLQDELKSIKSNYSNEMITNAELREQIEFLSKELKEQKDKFKLIISEENGMAIADSDLLRITHTTPTQLQHVDNTSKDQTSNQDQELQSILDLKEKEIQDLKIRNAQLVTGVQHSTLTASTSLSSKDAELNNEREKIFLLQDKIETLSSRIASQMAELTALRDNLERERARNIEMETFNNDMHLKNNHLQQKVEDMQQQLDEKHSSLINKERKLKLLQEEVDTLNETILTQDDKIRYLQQQSQRIKSKEIESDSKIAGASQVIDIYREKEKQYQADLDELTNKLKETRDQLLKSNKEKASLQTQYEEVEFNLRLNQQLLNDSKERIMNIESELSMLRKENWNLKDSQKMLQMRIKELEETVSDMNEEMKPLYDSIEKNKLELNKMKESLLLQESLKVDLESKIRTLKLQLENEKIKYTAVESDKSNGFDSKNQGNNNAIVEHIEQLQSQLSKTRGLYTDLESQLIQSQRDLSSVRIECVKKTTEKEELEREITRLQKKLSASEIEVHRLKEAQAAFEKTHHKEEPYQSQLVVLQQMIAQLQQNVNSQKEIGATNKTIYEVPVEVSTKSNGKSFAKLSNPSLDDHSQDSDDTSKPIKPSKSPDIRSRKHSQRYHDSETEEINTISRLSKTLAESTTVAKIIREAVTEALKGKTVRELDHLSAHSKSDTIGKGSSQLSNNHSWKALVTKEKDLLDRVASALAEENDYVRQKKQQLKEERDKWKLRKERSRNKPAALAELDEERQQLNDKATQLNSLSKKLKSFQEWARQREQKVHNLARLVDDIDQHDDYQFTSPGGSNCDQDSLVDHFDKLLVLENELDMDLTFIANNPSHMIGSREENQDRKYSNRRSNESQKKHSNSQFDLKLKMNSKESTSHIQDLEDYVLAPEAKSRPDISYHRRNHTLELNHPYMHSRESSPPSHQVNNLTWKPVTTSQEFASRLYQHHLTGSNGIVMNKSYDPSHVLREVSANQLRSTDAYDSHANFLSNLSKEIGTYSYSSSDLGKLKNSTQQQYQSYSIPNKGHVHFDFNTNRNEPFSGSVGRNSENLHVYEI